jgi:hypothetical protein
VEVAALETRDYVGLGRGPFGHQAVREVSESLCESCMIVNNINLSEKKILSDLN